MRRTSIASLPTRGFFDAATQVWIGNTWWAEELIHGAGSALVRAVALAGLVVLIGG